MAIHPPINVISFSIGTVVFLWHESYCGILWHESYCSYWYSVARLLLLVFCLMGHDSYCWYSVPRNLLFVFCATNLLTSPSVAQHTTPTPVPRMSIRCPLMAIRGHRSYRAPCVDNYRKIIGNYRKHIGNYRNNLVIYELTIGLNWLIKTLELTIAK